MSGKASVKAVFDYRRPGWLDKAGKFHLIFDTVGALGFGRSRNHLEQGGSYVTTLPGPRIFFDQFFLAPFLRRRARFFLVHPSGTELRELINAWRDGHLRIRVDRVYDWTDFTAAFTQSEDGHATGKIILRVTS